MRPPRPDRRPPHPDAGAALASRPVRGRPGTRAARTATPTRRAATPRTRREALALLAVAAGGALGTWVRYELTLALPSTTGSFPWAIFTANTAGAFILGAAMTLLLERFPPRRYVRPFVGIGFCGGLTTFSTWMVDVTVLADAGHTAVAAVDVLATVIVGLGSLVLGIWAARSLIRDRRTP